MKQKIEKLTDTKTHWFEESQQKMEIDDISNQKLERRN